MPLKTGQVLHQRYRIDALLGQGGMGAVYRATDLTFNTSVALKENLELTPEAQRQFGREAGLLHELRHPNLPRVTDHFSIQGRGQYLVMDYVEGEDLNQVLARQGPIAEGQALNWIGQVLDALDYLHSQNIIHRDVKPANVKITPEGRVYLVDFGLAKVQDPVQTTTTGARAVTPGFSPPEQYGLGRTDARSDMYSVGATLYALLTGTTPPDALESVTGQVQLVPPRQLNPDVSPQVEAAVLWAMQTRPTDRFQTADEFRAALIEPAPTSQMPVRQAQRPSAPSRRTPLPRWFWPMVGGAGALLLVIVFTVAALIGGGDERNGTSLPSATLLVVVEPTPPPPTSTPGPTDTPSPSDTPRPTSTIVPVVVPDGWRTYQHLSGKSHVAHPAKWTVEAEGASWVGFLVPNHAGSFIGAGEVALCGISFEHDPVEAKQCLAEYVADQVSSPNTFRLVSSDTWDDNLRKGYVVEYMTHDYARDIWVYHVFVVIPVPDKAGSLITASYYRVGTKSISDEERDTIRTVTRSIRIVE